MKTLERWFPLLVVAIAAAFVGSLVPQLTDEVGGMKLQEFGRLPVVYGGRVKPLDTLARNSLLIISDRQYFRDDTGRAHPAIEWLADVLSGSPRMHKHKVFRIANTQIQDLLGLKPREGFRYALEEFRDSLGAVDEAMSKLDQAKLEDGDVFGNKLVEFANKLRLVRALQESTAVRSVANPEDVTHVVEGYRQMIAANVLMPHLVPPLSTGEQWQPLLIPSLLSMVKPASNPAVQPLTSMMLARATDDVAQFNSSLKDYQRVLKRTPPLKVDRTPPATVAKLDFEVLFNHLEPFYNTSLLYVLVFLLAVLAWLGWSRPLNRAAFWLMAFAFVIHTAALIGRIYLSGRPPVTNLYSSAVFIGWGTVLFGLAFELFFKLGIGNILGAAIGATTLVIAHHLAGDGDTLQMMQAVLDTNFWLATHVVCVTTGYTATFVAGGLGIIYILRGLFSDWLDADTAKQVHRMIYGTICFAMFFSFVGTVLGGLWADDSWGRFWGWDTKENGALIIVLWNALMLHARWGGMVKQRGLAVLAVFGNVVTAWSWFGVNMLGVGLHSYGFMNSAAFWLGGFVISQMCIIALGLLPLNLWRSFSGQNEAPPRGVPPLPAASGV